MATCHFAKGGSLICPVIYKLISRFNLLKTLQVEPLLADTSGQFTWSQENLHTLIQPSSSSKFDKNQTNLTGVETLSRCFYWPKMPDGWNPPPSPHLPWKVLVNLKKDTYKNLAYGKIFHAMFLWQCLLNFLSIWFTWKWSSFKPCIVQGTNEKLKNYPILAFEGVWHC